jgi:hypothetical protein
VGVGSFLGSIVLGFVVARAISQSGFFTYLSLVWSDTELISYYTKEFLFSIGESLPVMEMIAFFGSSIFIFLVTARVCEYAYSMGIFKNTTIMNIHIKEIIQSKTFVVFCTVLGCV